ncbi:MAG: glycosyltransferase [Nitrospira sp.]|nr:glycosyltransferase [Nitrospira sp.]
MNVLAVLPPERWIEINLLGTLRQHYCDRLEVFTYPGGMGRLGSRPWRDNRDELNEQLVALARSLKASRRLDIMFFVVYDDFLTVETAKRLRDLNVPMVNYHVDMAFQWYRVIRTAPYFDVLAVAQMANTEHLKPFCQDIHWMPMAANPDWYASDTGMEPAAQRDICFVGSFNPYRRALLATCVDHGFMPTVYGRGWKRETPSPYQFDWDLYKIWHDLRYYALPRLRAEGSDGLIGPIRKKIARAHIFEELDGPEYCSPCSDEALPEIFRSSFVNLGFSDTGWHGGTHVIASRQLQCRLRDFEVPMSRGFYLTQEAPDHAEYYKIGEEIETWNDPIELIDKLSFYSKNIAATLRIRDAGKKRALQSHTWQHRFDRLFEHLRSMNRLL